jgi:hypothetical protein
MRTELRKILEYDFGYSIRDFDHAFQVAKKLDKEKFDGVMRRQAELEKEQPDLVDDIMDDIHWYSFLETFLIWHFALWRLQAIFEGYIVKNLLGDDYKTGGLAKKLKALRQKGFEVSDKDFNELIEWGQIRNALSHFPTSAYTDGILEENDVQEYLTLCKRIVTDLDNQKQNVV